MEVTVQRLEGTDEYDVSIGGGGCTNKIYTIFTDTEATVSKWVGDIKKNHRNSINKKKKKNPLIIGFSAEREIRHKKGGFEDNPIDILTLCYGSSSHCLIVYITDLMDLYGFKDKYRYFNGFPKLLKDLLIDSNTVLIGLDIEKASVKFEKDFGFKLERTVDLRSLAEKALLLLLLQGGGDQKKHEDEDRRKHGTRKLDNLLNRVMEPELKIRRPTKEIVIFDFDGITDEKVKYTTLDTFVAWKIGTKYVDLIKNNA